MTVPKAVPTTGRLRGSELTLSYDERVVVSGLDVEIPDGSFTVIVGPNACGKSTVLKALARMLRPRAGAVYLDGGWDAAADLVMNLLADRIEEAAAGPGGQDFKTRLQELAARKFEQLPRYEVHDDGPDHAKRFYAKVFLAGEERGEGEGRSKKQAEQGAARVAWLQLQELLDNDELLIAPAADLSTSGEE